MNKLKKLISLALSLCIMGSIAVTSSVTASAEFSQSSYAFSQNMTIGYNIGNSLDSVLTSSADETYWGCPKITQGLVQAIKDKGYDVIRIPVTWGFKIDSSGNFTDSSVHANRVKQVVDWAYDTGAYVILNTHHEMSWLNTWDSVKNSSGSAVDSSKQEAMLTKFGGLWKNIANTYKDYGERLIFEGYNETRSSETVWSSVTRDQEVLQKIGQKFIDTVRATGGNNEKRYLLLNTFGAVFSTNEVNTYKMPTDSADHLLFGVHTYDPHDLCFREYSGTTFSQSAFDSYYNTIMPAIETKFLSQGYGVILGEFGAVNKNNDDERVKYVKAVVTSCATYGVIPVWWGNGVINMNSSKDSFGLVNRVAPYEWVKDNIASAMVDLACQLVPSRPTRGGTSQTRTTTATNATQATTTTTTGSTSAVGANSTVIDWEDGDTSFVSSSTSVVSSKLALI
ncbi:MAG: glycoside hydrolase family 5 protein [Acutalibacteraceae bacterium]|nr:glycoside hydrolase family 5 protein [Acutalibacteraceae bacterium]